MAKSARWFINSAAAYVMAVSSPPFAVERLILTDDRWSVSIAEGDVHFCQQGSLFAFDVSSY